MNQKINSIYYGWVIVIALFVMLTFSSGLGFYNISVFMHALTSEQGFSVAYASGAISVFFIISGLAGLVAAEMLKRYDPRFTIFCGAAIGSLGLILIGHITEIWHIYAVFTIFGIGFSLSSLVPTTTLIARWFNKKRAIALAIASTGLSFGGMTLTPLAAKMIHVLGLQEATMWFGLIYFIGILPLSMLLIRSDPAVLGLKMDGGLALSVKPSENPANQGISYKDAITSRYFMVFTFSFLLVMMSQVGAFSHLFKLIADRTDRDLAATAISILAITSTIFRLIGGWLTKYMSLQSFAKIVIVMQAVSFGMLAVAFQFSSLVIGTIGMGMTMGNLLMLHPLLTAKAFGLKDYSRIFSISWLIITFGTAAGPGIMGILHDINDSYTLPYLFTASISFIGWTIMLFTGSSPQISSPKTVPIPEGS